MRSAPLRRRSLVQPRQIVFFALGPIGTAALTFVTLPVLAWAYSADDIGRVSLLQVLVAFSFVLFSLALDQAFVREFNEYPDTGRLLKTAFAPGFGSLLVGLAAVVGLQFDLSAALFGVPGSLLTLLVCLCVVMHYVTTFSALALRMHGKALAYSLINLSSKATFLVFVLASLGIGLERSFLALLIFHSVALGVSMVAGVLLARRDWIAALRSRIDRQRLPKLAAFAAPLIFGGLAYWGLAALDRVTLRWWSTFEQLGLYSVVANFAGVAVLVQSIFTTIWTPLVYKWHADGVDMTHLDSVITHVTATVVSVFALVGMFAWVLTYLLPEQYHLVQFLLPACIGGPLMYMLSETTGVGVNIARRTGLGALAPLTALLVTLGLNYLLVPRFGAAGAALSTCVAFFVFFLSRTELSVLVWQRIHRARMYACVGLCVAIASAQAMWHQVPGAFWPLIWTAVLCAALVCYRDSWALLMQIVRARLQSTRMN